jgi:hypothetical protein
MKSTILTLLFTLSTSIHAIAEDHVAAQRQYAHDAALVLLLRAEPVGEQTRFKIVEFWKRKAPDADISRYFSDGYLPFLFPRAVMAGQLSVAYYFLPTSGWGDNSRFMFGVGFIDGKITFNQFHESKPKQEFTVAEFKQFLANAKEPKLFICPAK